MVVAPSTQHLSLQLLAEATQVGMEEKELLLLGTVKAPAFESTTKRSPLQLCAVIDQSGSMQGEKMELVRLATTFIAGQLTENDTMSVVSYENNARVVVPMTKMTNENKKKVIEGINNIRPGGGTNICLGLITGLDSLTTDVSRDTVTSTLLLTDGQANDGPTSAEGIISAIPRGYPTVHSSHNYSGRGYGYGGSQMSAMEIDPPEKKSDNMTGAPANGQERRLQGAVNTFGFGSDHDGALLTTLSTKCDGSYYYVPGPNDIGPVFANCLGGLATVFALKAKVRFEGLNGCKIMHAHTRFHETKDPQGAFVELDIPDIQGQERKDIVLRVRVPSVNVAGQTPLIRMVVTYLNVLTDREDTVTQDISVERTQDPKIEQIPAELDIERNRVTAAEALAAAVKLGDRGEMREATEKITEAIANIKMSPSAAEEVNVGLIEDLQRATKGLKSKEEYKSGGQQFMSTECDSHWAQRQTSNGSRGQARYDTSAREQMVQNWNTFSNK